MAKKASKVAKASPGHWSLPPDEVSGHGSNSSSSSRGHNYRHSAEVTLTHVPTGITVTVETTRGNYTRKQMAALREPFFAQAWSQLEALVRKARKTKR